jgi:hypothetical protein
MKLSKNLKSNFLYFADRLHPTTISTFFFHSYKSSSFTGAVFCEKIVSATIIAKLKFRKEDSGNGLSVMSQGDDMKGKMYPIRIVILLGCQKIKQK